MQAGVQNDKIELLNELRGMLDGERHIIDGTRHRGKNRLFTNQCNVAKDERREGFYGIKRSAALASAKRGAGVIAMFVGGRMAFNGEKSSRLRVVLLHVRMLSISAWDAGQDNEIQTEYVAKPFHACKDRWNPGKLPEHLKTHEYVSPDHPPLTMPVVCAAGCVFF